MLSGVSGQRGADGRDDRHDPGALLVRRARLGGRAGSIRRRRRGCRRPRRPSPRLVATAASTGSPAAGSASRPSPENESGVTLRMPITYVRSPQRNVAGPIRVAAEIAPIERAWRCSGAAGSVMGLGLGVAQVRVVDEMCRAPPRRDRANRRRGPGPSRDEGRVERRRSDRPRRRPGAGRRVARQRAARSAAGSARGTSRLVQMTVAPASAAGRRRVPRPRPSTSLSAIDAVTRVIGPGAEERPQVVEGQRPGPRRRPGCGHRRAARRGRRRAAARGGPARPRSA